MIHLFNYICRIKNRKTLILIYINITQILFLPLIVSNLWLFTLFINNHLEVYDRFSDLCFLISKIRNHITD